MNCRKLSIFKHLVFIAVGCSILINNSCKQNKAVTIDNKSVPIADTINSKVLVEIKAAKELLKDGALVMRSDNDFESLTLQNFSKREQSYSHSGIAFKEAGGYVVYHCMSGNENPDGACRRDPFDSFVNPAKKTGFGIFQYQLSDTEKDKLHNIMKKNHAAKMPFDMTFNLKSDDSLYCSEMIYKGLKTATGGRVILPSSYIDNFKPKILGYKFNNAFFKKFEYIGLDDLYLNPFCKEVIRVKY